MTIRNNPSHGATTSGRMSEFDKLPKALRQALANADHNYSGEQIHRERRKRGAKALSIAKVIELIAANDKRQHDKDAELGLVCGGQRPAPFGGQR